MTNNNVLFLANQMKAKTLILRYTYINIKYLKITDGWVNISEGLLYYNNYNNNYNNYIEPSITS